MAIYTYSDNSGSIKARSHREAWAELCAKLSVSGPRALCVKSESGATVVASLYPGEDRVIDAKGRDITDRALVKGL